MKIKKVNDKTMVIHTKKKAKLHTHEPKRAFIKAADIYTVDRSPKIKGSTIATTENKKFRRSTIHSAHKAKKGMFRQYRATLKESKQSIKTKNSSIKVAGAAGTQTALSQMEGGEEVRDAANIAYITTRPAMGTASKVLSVKLDAPAPCRLDVPDLDFACCTSADCLHQHLQVI